jgi:hypothetical protein
MSWQEMFCEWLFKENTDGQIDAFMEDRGLSICVAAAEVALIWREYHTDLAGISY